MQMQNNPHDRFRLSFDLSPLGTLDKFGLLAAQFYNLGDRGNWFYYFRASSQGVDSRVYGIRLHYYDLHAWLPKRRHRTETEYHLASLFFNMDSVVECFVYMMNALGFAADPPSFKDITDQKAMKAIAPRNVIGDARQSPLAGYAKFFPSVQQLWVDNRELMELIMEQHDVSKHRFGYGLSGRYRNDPPPGFFESLNIDPKRKYEFSPMEEILLDTEQQIANGIRAVKGIRHEGTRTGNWLAKQQAQQLLNAPDTSTLKGLRDRAILGLLVGCGLRRSEVVHLTCDRVQQREARWVLIDLIGKRNKVRSVPMPSWAKQAIDEYASTSGVVDGIVFRPINKGGRLTGERMTEQAVYNLVTLYAATVGIANLTPHDLRRTFAKLASQRRIGTGSDPALARA